MKAHAYFKKWAIPVLAIAIGLTVPKSTFGISNFQKSIYTAYVTNDMQMWEQLTIDMERNIEGKQNTHSRYELANAQYGLIAYLIGTRQNSKAAKWVAKAEKNIEALLDEEPSNPRYLSMKGAIIGFQIGLNPLKAPFIGPKSLELINSAVVSDGNCPAAWLERANAQFYAPEMFGGSKKKAIESYEIATRLFERKSQSHGNWLYINTLIALANAYENQGENQKALEVYQKILKLEPEIRWVKNDLYPKLLKKMG